MTTAPKYLVSIDPGAANVAWAVFEDRVLKASGFTGVKETSDAARPFLVTDLFFQDLRKAFPDCFAFTQTHFIVEKPQVYTGAGKSKGDPNDLISVALVVGAVLEVAMGTYHSHVQTVLPAMWKGSVPKRITLSRLQKELSTEEHAVVKWSNHNVVDAIGIGCWKLGRYK